LVFFFFVGCVFFLGGGGRPPCSLAILERQESVELSDDFSGFPRLCRTLWKYDHTSKAWIRKLHQPKTLAPTDYLTLFIRDITETESTFLS